MKHIPIYTPQLTDKEAANVLDCMNTGWISSRGKYVGMFEGGFCKFTNSDFAVTVSNGTVALHLAFLALGIKEGDEVIVPTFTYIASVNAIRYVGATPVFVDSEPQFWQADVEDIARKITPKTKAILAVHLYGHMADMPAINKLAKKHNLYVVEDAAEAFGSYIKNSHAGTLGDIGAFSFFANKTITTGEGGMVTTQCAELDAKIRLLKNHHSSSIKKYWHDNIGYNYRMTNLCAAIGVAQLEQADSVLRKKADIAQIYFEALSNTPVTFQGTMHETTHSNWMVSLVLDDGFSRDALIDYLAAVNIETRPTFYPAHTMPMYIPFSQNGDTYPVAQKLSRKGISLPSYPGLTREDVLHVCAQIKLFFKANPQ